MNIYKLKRAIELMFSKIKNVSVYLTPYASVKGPNFDYLPNQII